MTPTQDKRHDGKRHTEPVENKLQQKVKMTTVRLVGCFLNISDFFSVQTFNDRCGMGYCMREIGRMSVRVRAFMLQSFIVFRRGVFPAPPNRPGL